MEYKKFLKSIYSWIQKYKYAVIILAVGIGLMVLPSSGAKKSSQPTSAKPVVQTETVEQRLSQILGGIKGAGEVQVMLTTKIGPETIYQVDTNQSSGDDADSINRDTVIVSDSDRVQSGLVSRVNSPIYQGAIVLCQGAHDANIRLAIVDAVSKITGLGSDKISVLELK